MCRPIAMNLMSSMQQAEDCVYQDCLVTWARDIRGLCRHKLIAVGRAQDVTLSRSFAASNRRVVTRLFSITSGARFE